MMTNTAARNLCCAALLACWTVSGCTQTPEVALTITPATPASGLEAIEFSSGNLVTPFNSASGRIEVDSLNVQGGVKVRVTTATGATASLDGVALPSGQWVDLPVSSLAKTVDLPLSVMSAEGQRHTYSIASLPADFPDYTVQATSPQPGIICFSANASDGRQPSYLFITDELGAPLYYKRLPDRGFNFQTHAASDGTVRYSYLQVEGPQLEGISTYLGTIRVLDSDFNEVERLSLLPHGDHGALPADLHEFVLVGPGHHILTSYVAKQVSNLPARPGTTSRVVAAVIQEVKDGRVVFEWDSSQHPEFYANASNGNDYTNATAPSADYMHMNSVFIDPTDGHLIVSFRHQDQVVKLDRQTGQIRWRLGGKNSDFPLTNEQRFSHQHHALRHDDGKLTIFDNGNASRKSRLLTFTLDEATKQLKDFVSVEPETRYSFAMGSYQKLDAATHFVGWGAAGDGLPDASEVNQDGVSTFSLLFTDPTYESYRALKYTP